MGLFSFSDEELSDQAIDAARSAWEEGLRFFAYRLRSGVGGKNDPDRLLTLTLNGVAGIGWRLHSATPFINTIGPNAEVVLLTFERP